MNGSKFKRILIFLILFAGAFEIVPETNAKEEDNQETKINIAGFFNNFKVTSCSSMDKYSQQGVRLNVDAKVSKHLGVGSGVYYSRTKRYYHEDDEDESKVDENDPKNITTSYMFSNGISGYWKYVRFRADFYLNILMAGKSGADLKFFGGAKVDAGKLNLVYGSLSIYSPEMPSTVNGSINLVLFKKYLNIGAGIGMLEFNIPAYQMDEDGTITLFLTTRIKIIDQLALKGFINFKPYADIAEVVEGSVGLELVF